MFENVLERYTQKLYNGNVILIANVYGKTPILTPDRLCLKAEFFTEAELDYLLTALKRCKYNVICYFDENKFIKDYLNGNIVNFGKEFLVFNLARNGYGIGKKSLIPTFCDLNGIKYTASNGYACSFARHKFHISSLLREIRCNSLESYIFEDSAWLNNKKPFNSNKKFIVKPLCESASQGITEGNIFNGAISDIDSFVLDIYNKLNHVPLLIQEFIEGFEAKTIIIDFDKSYVFDPVGVEIDGKHDLGETIISEDIAFDYAHSNYNLSSEIDPQIIQQIKEKAWLVYKTIGMQNYGRIDCRIDNRTKEFYFMDFATMPYFVSDGEMLFAFKQKGYDINSLMNAIINSALISKYNYSL